MTILMDIPENSMFLYGSPCEDWTPELVAVWLAKHPSAQAHADMYAQVWNLVDILRVNFEDKTCTAEDFCEWDEFMNWFSDRMISLQQSLGLAPEGTGLPLAQALAPIMNAHGYQNGSGWWAGKHEGEDAFGGKPPSRYVEFESYAEKAEEIEQMLTGLEVTTHTCEDEEHSHLYEGDVALDIQGPHPECDIWIELAEEATLGMAGWHTHYSNYEHDYQLFEYDLKRLISGEVCVATFFLGDEWIGSLMLDNVPATDEDAYSLLETRFLQRSAEWRKKAEAGKCFIKIRSWATKNKRDFVFA